MMSFDFSNPGIDVVSYFWKGSSRTPLPFLQG